MTEYFGSGTKMRGRGMAEESIFLIEAMRAIAESMQPITGRGIGYKLFVRGLIPNMGRPSMKRVYRLLGVARERGIIPWEWIVDETREFERAPVWDDPEAYAFAVARSYRRDFWNQQPERVEVVSEKGTVRGVLQPVLDELAVGLRAMHGYSSATAVYDIAQDDDDRPLTLLYVGDWDPSGMDMSERDLPNRLERYGGDHVTVERVALLREDLASLPSFQAEEKKNNSRHKWFVENFGHECWEIDAMDPNDLRARVREEIIARIEPYAWERCERINAAEQESLRNVLEEWGR
jgi:hypothetical protein